VGQFGEEAVSLQQESGMSDFKKLVRWAAKIIGGTVGLVFLRAPFTELGWELMGGSFVIGLICFRAYRWAQPDEAENSD
jgi:hypothetical protein